MNIIQEHFGTTPQGEKVDLFTLSNKNGMVAKITNYGGIITSLGISRDSEFTELVLGFESLDQYTNQSYTDNCPFFGAIIGRFGNRINKGHFILNGKHHQLACNIAPHHLHGGTCGFDKKVWNIEKVSNDTAPSLQLSYISNDGEENYPGTMKVSVTYTLTNDNELQISYLATTDSATPVNLTNHTYFNLSGGIETIHNHKVQIDSEETLDVDSYLVPTGETNAVSGTVYDFREEKTLGQDIDKIDGYDNCYVFNSQSAGLNRVAVLSSPKRDIQMEVYTNSPSMQLYTGKYIDVKGEKSYGSFDGVALETQEYPDAPNHDNFPSCILNPGEEYKRETVYKFTF